MLFGVWWCVVLCCVVLCCVALCGVVCVLADVCWSKCCSAQGNVLQENNQFRTENMCCVCQEKKKNVEPLLVNRAINLWPGPRNLMLYSSFKEKVPEPLPESLSGPFYPDNRLSEPIHTKIRPKYCGHHRKCEHMTSSHTSFVRCVLSRHAFFFVFQRVSDEIDGLLP